MPKPLIIPIFIPHAGCPHQCAFCDQTIIAGTPPSLPDFQQMEETVDRYLSYRGARNPVALAFFGGNFLGQGSRAILRLTDAAGYFYDKKKIHSMRFSTRPDTISQDRLDLIASCPVSAVEIGAQSMNDTVLEYSLRGHTARDTENAVKLLRKNNLGVGLQMMVGLMGDTTETALDSAGKMADLAPDFVRVYPLIVLKSSLMAQWFYQKEYTPLTLEESVTLVKKIYNIFVRKHIPVIRMGLQSSDLLAQSSAIAAGPWHPAFGHLVLSELFFDKACDLIDQIRDKNRKLVLKVHPASESRIRGNKNENIQKLYIRYPGTVFTVKPDPLLNRDRIAIEQAPL